MARFRKKPTVIEAEQFFADRTPWPAGVNVHFDRDQKQHNYVYVSHEGATYIRDGDWIIKDVRGRIMAPCTPEIFEAIYEAIDD